MTKVLITGCAGFVGSNLVDILLEKGYDVCGIDNFSTGKLENLTFAKKYNNFDFYKTSITKLDSLFQIFNNEGPDFVFHIAALPRVQLSINDPLHTNNVNIDGTLNVLLASRKAKVKKVIYSASSSAYGYQERPHWYHSEEDVFPLDETMLPNPLSPYGLQKLVGEKYCELFYKLYGLETVSLRYFNVFGKRQDPFSQYSAVIPKFIQQHKEEKDLTIYGDGEQSRDFTFIEDVVNANIAAMKSNVAGEVINIGGGRNVTVNKIAELIGGRNVKKVHLDPVPGEARFSLADITKAKKLLNWTPKWKVEDGIEKLLK